MNAITPIAKAPRSTKLRLKPPADTSPVVGGLIPSAPAPIALSLLRRAPENVRHVRIDEDVQSLADDIAAHGLLQSLIGYAGSWPEDQGRSPSPQSHSHGRHEVNAPSIVKLDQRLSRAAEIGKGIKLEPADLDLLASLGLFNITARAKADYLKEQTRCRDARRRSIDGANTGSAGIGKPTGLSALPISPSFGTTPPRDVSEARQRGRRPRTMPS